MCQKLTRMACILLLYRINYMWKIQWQTIISCKTLGRNGRTIGINCSMNFMILRCPEMLILQNIPKALIVMIGHILLTTAWMKGQRKNAKKNIEIRKKLTDPHTGGSKSNSRLKAEMEYELGRSVSRGEVYIATHTKKDGSYVTDEARQISEKILEIEKEDSTSRSISQQDSLAKVLGKEHSGRVRALGFGPCPSQIFGNTNSRFSGMMSSQPTQNTDLQVQQKIHQLESQLETEKLKRKGYEGAFTYIFQKLDGNVPAEFARLFTTPAQDEESGQASPATARPSSPCQNNNEDLHRLHSP